MKTTLACLSLGVALWGCGGGGLPDPDGGGTGETLWPLKPGSTWTYRIDDPLRGQFVKEVEVVGEEPVPSSASGLKGIKVVSVQPHLEEISWQTGTAEGLVYRVREEDRRDGATIRTTTWQPSTIKSIERTREVGWSLTSSVNEVVLGPDGTEIENSDKDFVWRVVAVDEEVTVPAGTFKAVRVQRDRSDKVGKERTYWLAPGVGKIREEGERLEELESFDIAD